jgi:hypothetical protein
MFTEIHPFTVTSFRKWINHKFDLYISDEQRHELRSGTDNSVIRMPDGSHPKRDFGQLDILNRKQIQILGRPVVKVEHRKGSPASEEKPIGDQGMLGEPEQHLALRCAGVTGRVLLSEHRTPPQVASISSENTDSTEDGHSFR